MQINSGMAIRDKRYLNRSEKIFSWLCISWAGYFGAQMVDASNGFLKPKLHNIMYRSFTSIAVVGLSICYYHIWKDINE